MNVFDFDNTIYDGETLIDFALHYVKTDPKIWKYVPKLLVICFKDAFHLFTVEEAIEAYASFLEGYFIHIKRLTRTLLNFGTKTRKKLSLGIMRSDVMTTLSFPARQTFCLMRL